MPSSDEEDYRESASDGDPPYGADEVDTPMAAPLPPPPAPAPAPAPIVPSLPPTTVDQAAAAIPVNPLPIPAPPAAATPAPAPGPAPALTPASGSGTPTGSVNGGGESGGAFTRRYDELEDIIFSNPKSFVTLANEIATYVPCFLAFLLLQLSTVFLAVLAVLNWSSPTTVPTRFRRLTCTSPARTARLGVRSSSS
jgi:hypothetical protein